MNVNPKDIRTLDELRGFFAANFPDYLVMKSKYDEIVIRTRQTTHVGQDLVTWSPKCPCGNDFDESAMVLDLPKCSSCMGCEDHKQLFCAECVTDLDELNKLNRQIFPWLNNESI